MIAKIKGTQDILPAEASAGSDLERSSSRTSPPSTISRRSARRCSKPSELFHRGVGDTTDIVEEGDLRLHADRGDRMLTLRPEGTASVVRSRRSRTSSTPKPPSRSSTTTSDRCSATSVPRRAAAPVPPVRRRGARLVLSRTPTPR
ncbi:MAG: hypothetical protein MZU97_11770 [Bacillus subtilis]|nr:hypothetical protein [Bacillus subtilis]